MSTIKMHVKDLWISFIRPGSGDFSLSPEERKALHHRRVEKVIRFCWALIVLKSFAVVWAFNHYSLPFSPLWVVAPTVIFAALATAAYYYLRD